MPPHQIYSMFPFFFSCLAGFFLSREESSAGGGRP